MPVFPDSLALSYDDIVLRDWSEDDAPALREVCGDPDVCRFTTVPWTYSPEAAVAWVCRVGELRTAGAGLALAITTTDRPEALGNVNLVRFSGDDSEAALGYWLTPGARSHGYATAAAKALCGWGFEELKLKRIELAILPENRASFRVAQRLGARSEGLRRDSHESEGRSWDMEIYSLQVDRD